MEFIGLHKQITQQGIAGLNDLYLPYEDNYSFFGLGVKFKSNSLNLLTKLAKSYAHFLSETGPPEIEFRFIENGPRLCNLAFITPVSKYFIYKTNNGIIAVYCEGETQETKTAYLGESPKRKLPLDRVKVINGAADNGQVFSIIEFLVTAAVAGLSKQTLFFHAASLAWQGNGIILAGETGHGKTTLSVGLACAGFNLLSDEVTCLDLTAHKLLPFPQPIYLRGNALNFLKPVPLGERTGCQDSRGEQRWPVNLEKAGIRFEKGACPPVFFFILKGFKEQPEISPASVREAIWYTLSSAYAKISDPPRMLLDLGSAFGQLKCYHLWSGRIEETTGLIRKLINREMVC